LIFYNTYANVLKMLPEKRTFISPHQFNSHLSGVNSAPQGMNTNRQAAPHQIPERPLQVQPRAITNPFHRLHHELTKHRIYDRLHPRNMYHTTMPSPRPEQQHEVQVDIDWSRHRENK